MPQTLDFQPLDKSAESVGSAVQARSGGGIDFQADGEAPSKPVEKPEVPAVPGPVQMYGAPWELRTDAQKKESEGARHERIRALKARGGKADESDSPLRLDTTYQKAKFVANAVDPFGVASGLVDVAAGAGKVLAPGALKGNKFNRYDLERRAEGAHQAIGGAFEAATPFMGASAVAAPVKTAATIAVGVVSQTAVAKGLKALGMPEAWADLAGDAAGVIAGAATHKLAPKAIESIKAKYGPVLEQRAAGRAEGKPGTQPTSEAPPAPRGETLKPGTVDFQAAPETKAPSVETGSAKSGTTPRQPQPDGATYAASGLGGFEPFIGESVREMRELAEKRRTMLEELEKAKTTPGQASVGQRIIQWFTGERDVWGLRVNQAVARARKIVPDVVDQEALSLMRDFKSRPGELQQWLDGTHPNLPADPDARTVALSNIEKLRPAIERALNPTPQMLRADQILTSIADVSLQEGRRVGFLDSSITPDNYVTHILHPRDAGEVPVPLTERAGSAMGGKIGRRFAFSEKRQYPTLLDAIADNVKPRTLNALDAFTIHGDKFATARATRMLVQELRDSKMGKWGTGSTDIPADWVEIAPHAHPFQNTVSFIDQGGEPASARQTLYVPKFIEEALRPITDPDYTSRIAGFRAWRGWSQYTKAAQLGLSFFHAKAMNLMAFWNMGPRGWVEAVRADRESQHFLDEESDFVQHTGTTAEQGRTFEAYRNLKPGSIPTWGDIWRKAPAIKQMDELAQGVTSFTFNNLQRRFKVTNYALAKAKWLANNPNATPREISDAKISIAKEVNAVYGGLNWENMGVNRSTTEALRAIMLAPDWTFSNVANVKYAMERGARAGKMARAFWLRAAATVIIGSPMLSLFFTRDPKGLGERIKRDPRKYLTNVWLGVDKNGKDITQNLLAQGAPGDMVTLMNNSADYGAIEGLARTAANKENPALRTWSQLQSNRNWLGQEIAPRGGGITNDLKTLKGAAEGMAPVPFSITNLYQMLAGPDADQYIPTEYVTTILGGTPPRHVKPPGTPEEEAKKAKARTLGHFELSEEGRRQQGVRADYVRRIKAGDPKVDAELDALVDAGTMSFRQRQNLYRAAGR